MSKVDNVINNNYIDEILSPKSPEEISFNEFIQVLEEIIEENQHHFIIEKHP